MRVCENLGHSQTEDGRMVDTIDGSNNRVTEAAEADFASYPPVSRGGPVTPGVLRAT